MRVHVVPADPRWPAQFTALQAELTRALADVAVVGIEHVGSTSVPGLAAKPVLDIDIIVRRPDLAAAITGLTAAGYTHRGDLGIADRHAFTAPSDGVARHVYVVIDGCLALRNHLGVRDVLRAELALRDEYGALKLRLAEHDHESIDSYIAGKSAVLQRILIRAGLTDDDRDTIDRNNQPLTPSAVNDE